MTAQLKVGNIVQLKSGGPPMTIRSVEAINGECLCEWFGGGSALKSHTFALETLKGADASEEVSLAERPAKARERVAQSKAV
jgi:uncharacterized protein YodC (DUF2158 family)